MYNGGKSWTLVGNGLDRGVLSLAVYNGELYAGTGRGAFRVYKYTPGFSNVGIMNWTRVVDYPWDGARELFVSRGFLLIGDSLYDRIGRWDGRGFMPTWMRAGLVSTILQSLGSMFTQLPTLVCFIGSGMVFGGSGFWITTGAGICGLWRYIGAGCLWGITTEGVELCWRSAWGACL